MNTTNSDEQDPMHKVHFNEKILKKEFQERSQRVFKIMNMMNLALDKLKNRSFEIKNKWTIEELAHVLKVPMEVAREITIDLSMYGYLNVYQGENGVQFYEFDMNHRVKNMKSNLAFFREKVLEWEIKIYKVQEAIKQLEQ